MKSKSACFSVHLLLIFLYVGIFVCVMREIFKFDAQYIANITHSRLLHTNQKFKSMKNEKKEEEGEKNRDRKLQIEQNRTQPNRTDQEPSNQNPNACCA